MSSSLKGTNMAIKLSILEHQTDCIRALAKVFDDAKIRTNTGIHSNPTFDFSDEKIKENIAFIQRGEDDFMAIPKPWRSSVNDGVLGLDIRMETGTGKTYCYTRLMYELNKLYGFIKFIILVPSTPIKEGTRSFIEADYSKKHFADLYPGKSLALSVLDPQKASKKGRKMFPQAISDFARGTRLERNRLYTLLMGSGMLLSKATMEKDYDQTLIGGFSKPYETLATTRPIVIIDEPHRFKRENKAYKTIVEKLNPLCVIRFGATFPEVNGNNNKDYNNLVFNLGSCEAFNENLVKGVATQMILEEGKEPVKIKVTDITRSPKSCQIRNEVTGKSYTLGMDDSLSIVDADFHGIKIANIGNTDHESIKTGVTLSNGQVLAKGSSIYAGIYGATYQELMIKQAIVNHIEQERENFFKQSKIKTLTLFFIDSIKSYRGEETDGYLRLQFENFLQKELQKELDKYSLNKGALVDEYTSFLKASLDDIKATNGGYFAEDNATSDEDIQNEVDQILRDKQRLLSFKDETGQWNTRRFIFSKWTLREGWDNPNVFQIAKLRSSGSETSKLQEVGRGLRLPVDEFGNRISDEQFYLTYLIDYSEKDFAKKLKDEINGDVEAEAKSIKTLLAKVAEDRGLKETDLFIEFLQKGYVDLDGFVLEDKAEDFYIAYPEFRLGLQQNKIVDKTKKQNVVGIRKDKFSEIKSLWSQINKKYYLKLEEIPSEELFNAAVEILKSDIHEEMGGRVFEQRTVITEKGVELRESGKEYLLLDDKLPYGEFLKMISKSTALPLEILHKAFCEYDKIEKITPSFFNNVTASNFILAFQEWFENAFIKRFSYKSLDIEIKETALTDVDGNVKDSIVQSTIGIFQDPSQAVPDKFLYDSVVFDSPKEKENIKSSNIEEVVVFGKIPRRSIRVPLYFGGTTSPDFMYLLRKNGKDELNFIIETKGVENESGLRNIDRLKIESAKQFFETLKIDGLNVRFVKQLSKDGIENLIKKVLK